MVTRMWQAMGLWTYEFLMLPPYNQKVPAILYRLRCLLGRWGVGGWSQVRGFTLLVMVAARLLLPDCYIVS